MQIQKLESEILRRIVPSPELRASIKDRADRLKAKVEAYVKEHGIKVEAVFAGSYSKNTYLSDPDLDLFLMFPSDVSHDDLKRIGLQAGDDILHGERMFADHPYTRGVFEGLEVDMVPCYRVNDTGHMKSAVDRTPFHTAYMKSHLTDDGCDQVRLLKMFMKGIGAYGAEQDSRGFSGYMCEVLIVKYGTFDAVLEAASKEWKTGITIAVEEKGPKFNSPMVVYDPVDVNRNAASAVHEDTLALFIVAAREYLKNPAPEFFFPNERKPLSRDAIREKATVHGTRIVSAVFEKPEAVEDSLLSQLWRTQYALAKQLNKHGFNVIRAVHAVDDKMSVVFELENDRASLTHKHSGPSASVDAQGFLDRWKDNPYGEAFIEDGVWNILAPRQYTDAATMIRKEAGISGIGKNMDADRMTVLDHEQTLEKIDPLILTRLLDPRFPWQS